MWLKSFFMTGKVPTILYSEYRGYGCPGDTKRQLKKTCILAGIIRAPQDTSLVYYMHVPIPKTGVHTSTSKEILLVIIDKNNVNWTVIGPL